MHARAFERTRIFAEGLQGDFICKTLSPMPPFIAPKSIQNNAYLFRANVFNRRENDEKIENAIKSFFFSHFLSGKKSDGVWGLNPGSPLATSHMCQTPLQEISEWNTRPLRKVISPADLEYKASLMKLPMRRALLELFRETVRVLKANDIRYWISGGTLLGAVRHKGFIPWDDDIDLCIDMNDESKLLQAFQFPYFLEFNPIFGYKTYSQDKDAISLLPLTCYGIFIDFFLMESNNYAYRQAFRPARQAWPREIWLPQHLFPLIEYEFEGIRVKGPYQPTKYLFEMYGPDCLSCGRIPPVLHGRYISSTPIEVPKNIWS